MASAVKAIKAKNAAKAEQLALEKEAQRKREEEMLAKMKEGAAPPKLKRRMTKEEKEVAALHKAYLRKQQLASMPKIKGYGRLTLHWPFASKLLPYQLEACKLYNTDFVTWFVAAVIIGNFLAICYEKEIDPYPEDLRQYTEMWEGIDIFSNIVFIIEIIINYYGAGTRRFWTSGWNIFDFIVVVVGILTMTKVDLGPFKMLKIFRAFRVFRLFKRIQSLNKIIVSLFNAVPGVANAFVIMLIVMAIYAIIAVETFRSFGGDYDNPHYETIQGNSVEGELKQNITSITARGFVIGDEYYGTFSRALYTLFQTLTGESWSEAIARPLLFGFDPYNATFVGFFFASFLLLMQIVLVNVVVAVLLEKFVTDDEDEALDSDDEEARPRTPSQEAAEPAPSPAPKLNEVLPTPDKAPATTSSSSSSSSQKSTSKAAEKYVRAEGIDAEVEILKLQQSMTQLHATLDLIMKALETEGKVFSGSTGATHVATAASTGSGSGSGATGDATAAPAPADAAAEDTKEESKGATSAE